MNHRVKLCAFENPIDRRRIAEVDFVQRDFVGYRREIAALDLRIVEIVEVIEHRDLVTFADKLFHQVRADKTSAARDQNPHRASVGRKHTCGKGEARPGACGAPR